MPTIMEQMQKFFDVDEWHVTPMDDRPVLAMGFSGKNGNFQCFAQAREEQQQTVFYSVCSINAPDTRRAATAEFITRANYGLIIGNFELDYDDGEVRFKTSIDVEGDSLSENLMRHIVYANVLTMDRYLPGLMKVFYGNDEPEDVIREIEEA